MSIPHARRHFLLAGGLALSALATAVQAQSAADTQLDCARLHAELTALAAAPPAAAADNPAAAAAGAQLLGALAQQAAARSGKSSGGLGSMLGGLMGGGAPAAPAAQGTAGQVLQLVQVAQAVQGAPAGDANQAQQAQAQAAAVAQVATLQALAQQRGIGRSQAEATGVLSMLGGVLSAAQAAQPVATPGGGAIQQLAGSRQEQLGGLFLAKGCKLPG